MAFQTINIDEFIQLAKENLVLDVRSPSEYHHAHFPGAYSFPLFTDEERKVIGTAYKQESRAKAVRIGLNYFSPKMIEMVDEAEKFLKERNSKTVLVHCWRGGMRSGAIAWLLDLYGYKVFQLEGGYKKFRNWVLAQFEKDYHLRILSGFTGSGKTEILHELTNLGEAVIDLEGLAFHRGSAFGGIGLPTQPSNEYFENKLALELFKLTENNENRLIWVESESSRIGNDVINYRFHEQMKNAERIHIEIPQKERLQYITKEYGDFDKIELEAAVERIQKRLGGLETKNVISLLGQGNVEGAFEILIRYYDDWYKKSKVFQPAFMNITLSDTNAVKNAQIILEKTKEYHV